jgi:hypothetical protein
MLAIFFIVTDYIQRMKGQFVLDFGRIDVMKIDFERISINKLCFIWE